MQRPPRLTIPSLASRASLLFPGNFLVKEYQFSANTLIIAFKYILFARNFSYSTTTQPQTV